MKFKLFYLLLILLSLQCIMRVDWDNNGKPPRVLLTTIRIQEI